MRRWLIAAVAALAAVVGTARAQTDGSIYPILINNGVARLTCDGTFRFINTAPLAGKYVVGTYLFGNLLTAPTHGADVILWSPSYGGRYPPPYTGAPSSRWGALGNLHIFSQPAGHSGGRQGDRERWFPAPGVRINDHVQLVVICWGGGTIEVYAQIFVRDAQ